ncbi:MAG: protein kinase family protein [Gemmatimonadaceae bacterium]
MTTHPSAKFGDRYDILTELGHGEQYTSYAARHRTLDRDVSITVLRANTPAERNLLGVIAADARILGAVRNEHILPVLDSRWLSDDELALVRPRVKGTTLRSIIQGAGTLSPKRTEELLREIGGVLEWSSRNGVVHRYVSPDSICVLQGSRKVMVSFGPPVELEPGKEGAESTAQAATPRLLRHCTDSNSLATLGFAMLTGHDPAGGEGSIRHLRPDVPPPMAEVIDEGLRCDGQVGMMPLASFMARLGGAGSSPRDAGLASRAIRSTPAPVRMPPASPAAGGYPPAQHSEPVGRAGRGLRVGMALLVLAVVAIAAWAAIQGRRGDGEMARARRDTGTATGEVVPRSELLGERARDAVDRAQDAAAARARAAARAATEPVSHVLPGARGSAGTIGTGAGTPAPTPTPTPVAPPDTPAPGNEPAPSPAPPPALGRYR